MDRRKIDPIIEKARYVAYRLGKKVPYGHQLQYDDIGGFDSVEEYKDKTLKILEHLVGERGDGPSWFDLIVTYRGKIVLSVDEYSSNRPFLYVPGTWERKVQTLYRRIQENDRKAKSRKHTSRKIPIRT